MQFAPISSLSRLLTNEALRACPGKYFGSELYSNHSCISVMGFSYLGNTGLRAHR